VLSQHAHERVHHELTRRTLAEQGRAELAPLLRDGAALDGGGVALLGVGKKVRARRSRGGETFAS
jgi:hypothetical protein